MSLFAEGLITLDGGFCKKVNIFSGKSSKITDFTEPAWGNVMRKYLLTINNNLCESSLSKIAVKATELSKITGRNGLGTTISSITGDDEDDHMLFVDLSDDDEW
jgi:hypothetical protein